MNDELSQDITSQSLFQQMIAEIMADTRLYKRLRYTVAMEKMGGAMTEKQGELLAADLIPHCQRYGLVDSLTERPETLRKFYIYLRKVAWESCDTIENFKLLKAVGKQKHENS